LAKNPISLIDVSVQGTALNFSLRHAPHVVREGAAAIFVAEKHSSPKARLAFA
jgi:hypothetical protein